MGHQRWFFVTGCDSGFGNQLVKLLDAAGHGVFAGCFLQDSIPKLANEGTHIVPLHLDVCCSDSVMAAAEFIETRLCGNGLDGLVNNAAILVTPAPVELTPVEAFRRMYEVNVLGGVAVTQSVLPLLRRARGRIVMVASVAGRIGLPLQPAYCASKHAVEGLSDVLRIDMLSWGVTVHVIEPGIFPNTGLYNTWKHDTERMWAELPETLQADYGEAHMRQCVNSIDFALTNMGTSDSSLVPKAMLHALTSTRPKYRYRVGNDSKFTVTVLSWLHERTRDFVLAIARPPRAPAKIPPAAAPLDGVEVARKRYSGGEGKRWWLLLAVLGILWKRGHIKFSPKSRL
eukprot:TRINITY_DN48400_c0_g1_i1.p1 TRINITY_DN48400_c0_g1~~TRINITY_DN48400_c0_g1_i1.p1  ORF type:complete len:343 (-),score=32.53 TRINITY_DN48400_c0_g1_i1:206-1234(-)